MKDYFSIGELSRLFGLNVQTLYYYDSIGLFSPSYRDPKNGRRKYEFDQVYPLATICYMRRLGYSLEEIMNQRNTQHLETTLDSLELRSAELHRQWQELILVEEAIQRKLHFIKEQLKDIQTDQITVRHYGPRKYFAIGDEKIAYKHNSFYFYPTMAFYEGNKKYFGAYLYPGDEQIPDSIPASQVKELPEGDYLCGYHLGSYETMPATIRRLRSFRPDLKLDGLAINFNIVDQFVESSRANYITHTQIRVTEETQFR